MPSIRDRIAGNTATLPSAKDIDVSRKSTSDRRPKTAPGIMGELAAAESRIKELEKESIKKSRLLIANIEPNPYQPRVDFSEDGLRNLANSIEESGLVQPILVRKHPKTEGVYQTIAGERRLRAHTLLGRTEIEAKVVEADDHLMATLALTENLAREDLSDYEAYKGIAAVQSWWPTRKSLADALGISRAQFYRLLTYGDLPKFVLDSLDKNPTLIGGNVSQELKTYLAEAGSPAVNALEDLMPKLIDSKIEQSKLVSTLRALVLEGTHSAAHQPSSVTKLFVGTKIAGRIVRNASGLTLKLHSAVVTDEMESKLKSFAAALCEGSKV